MSNASGVPIQADRPKSYLIVMMVLLCIATFCEGYDFFIISLVLKRLAVEFNIEVKNVIYVLAAVNGGGVLGFFMIRLGDRIGRKPVLIMGVVGYAGLSILTAMIPSIRYYLVLQFFTKMFLVTEFGTAIVMVTEEFPAKSRGTGVAILEVAGAMGGGAAMILSKFILVEWGWRGMYWLGGIPLILVPLMLLFVKETKYFELLKSGDAPPQPGMWDIWKSKSRKYIMPVGMLWFLGYLSYAGVIYFWPLYAETEHGWGPEQIGPRIALASVVGMTGYLVSGAMMDLIGRRITAIIFFLASAASVVWAFTSTGAMIIPSIVVCMFFVFALLPINSTYNAELFPTNMRSNAAAWCNALIGRPAQVVAPFIVAVLISIVNGVGNAVCFLAIGPLAAAMIVIFILPETKGIEMDDV